MCGMGDADGTKIGGGDKNREPEAMKRMATVFGVDGLLSGAEREAAAERCAGCTDAEACAHWLSFAVMRGADHAPGFCRNAEPFDELASEAPTSW